MKPFLRSVLVVSTSISACMNSSEQRTNTHFPTFRWITSTPPRLHFTFCENVSEYRSWPGRQGMFHATWIAQARCFGTGAHYAFPGGLLRPSREPGPGGPAVSGGRDHYRSPLGQGHRGSLWTAYCCAAFPASASRLSTSFTRRLSSGIRLMPRCWAASRDSFMAWGITVNSF